MQADAAERLGGRPGDRAELALGTYGPVDVVVTGLYAVDDASDPLWAAHPDLVGARDAASTEEAGHVALLVSETSLPDVQLVVRARLLTTQLTYAPEATRIDAGSIRSLRTAVTQ